jgi:trehalose/maltose hydrolase-like predicted phosphorylase
MGGQDEYANHINNGAFTLASASKILTTANYFRELYGQGANETWTQMANNVQIPYDVSGITVEYEGMNNSVPVKQADVVLSTYPFNYRNNYTEQQSLNDLDYVCRPSPHFAAVAACAIPTLSFRPC